MRILILSMFMIAAVARPAMAGPMAAPTYDPNRHVYTIPDGFDPPLIGRGGIAEIEEATRRLHFPYVVVLVQSLPAGRGSPEERAADAVNGLAQDWTSAQGYDVGKTSIFLLSYDPKQYRFLAGGDWKARLGFEKGAHKPYTALFEKHIKGTPKNPKAGIIDMMRAVDEYVFDQTDPTRIAARAEAERLRLEAERRQNARSGLDKEIMRLQDLLAADAEMLPPDAEDYRALLERARAVRTRDVPDDMMAHSAHIRGSVDNLESYVDDRRSERRAEMLKVILLVLVIAVAVSAVAVFVLRRRQTMLELRTTFATEADKWRKRVQNAASRYVEFYGERGSVLGLKSMSGQTKDLYDKSTGDIDVIYAAVQAMGDHFTACVATAAKGGFLNLQPLRSAIEDLEAPFEYDTGALNQNDLFGAPTKHMRITPETFVTETQARFAASLDGWKRLKDAADAALTPASERFRQADLDELIKKADADGIPHRWLSDHPLFGDDASDQTFWQGLDAIRAVDPVAYSARCVEVEKQIAKIQRRLVDGLIPVMRAAEHSRGLIRAVPSLDIALDPADDPMIALDVAHREWDKLQGALASADSPVAVNDQSDITCGAYQKAAAKLAEAQSAMAGAAAAITSAEGAGAAAAKQIAAAEARVAVARRVHADVARADAFIRDARAYAEAAARDIEKARRQSAERRKVNARRNADAAAEQYSTASSLAGKALKHCDSLDAVKAQYEAAAAQAGNVRERHEQRIRQYGYRTSLPGYSMPAIRGAADYAALSASLASTQAEWAAAERRARTEHEEAERRARAAAEAERRRREAEEEAERQRRSSYHSYSSYSSGSSYRSDSGSSWGGSCGGSDSGGSWGGGGDSSSGGGW